MEPRPYYAKYISIISLYTDLNNAIPKPNCHADS